MTPARKVYAVEVSGICNLESFCTHCPMHNRPRSRLRGLMSDEVVDLALEWVDKLGKVDALALHNFGEPLLHPRFCEIAKRFKELTPITVSTNGVTLDDSWADKLAEVGFAWISVSPWKKEAADKATFLLEARGVRVMHPPGVTHNWAGQAAGPSQRIFNHCPFLQDGLAVIRWDGTVASCCVSDRSEDVVGTVYNKPEDVFLRDYSICSTCHHAKGA